MSNFGNQPPGGGPPWGPPGPQYPGPQYPQAQPLQGQYPPGQYPPAQYPPGQYPAAQYPPAQHPPAQYPPGQYPAAQHPQPQYYPPQPQYAPHAPAPPHLMPAGMQPMMGPPTVMGVPLEMGERVIYFKERNYTIERVAFVVIGVLTLMIFIGIIFIVLAFFVHKWGARAQIITSRRVINIDKNGVPAMFALWDITDLEAKRRSSGRGLIGMAVVAIANSMAAKRPKMERSYWARAYEAVLVLRNNTTYTIPTGDPLNFGPLLARCVLMQGSSEHCPPVAYKP